ncbi:hypothetical protein [uncultured Gimesia sp.]|uniref:hypothetical protein n=1 Tax=uncultured Gimesia sp. TaxID=1678688 RepID=UPI0030DDBE34|tara:strand:- start:4005 stop:4304 length:300 start_codon:yes stop_codon:yes gene_type:complete
MIRILCAVLIVFQIQLVGCGNSSDSDIVIGTPSKIPTPTALSVEEWKAMPNTPEKFEPSELDRVRRHDPALKSNKAWEKFQKEIVGPELRKNKPQKEPI